MAETKGEARVPGLSELLVYGAVYVGLTIAVSLRQARPGMRILVLDAAPEGVWQRDGRASAVAAAAVCMLRQLGCWEEIEAEAQPITEMVITDSRTSDPVRPVFLTFGGEATPGEPFAHMVMKRDLNGALRRRAGELGIEIRQSAAVESFETGTTSTRIHLAGGEEMETRLLIAADGMRSRLRAMAGIKTVEWKYGQ